MRLRERDAVAAAFAAQRVETRIHYTPALHRHPAWGQHRIRHDELTQAEAWAAEELLLPMHPGLLTREAERVAEAVHRVFAEHVATPSISNVTRLPVAGARMPAGPC
jgi:dTDP-4-amino-4,6-dideoxygalactose transaminase